MNNNTSMSNSERCLYTQDLKTVVILAFLSVVFILIWPFNATPLRIIFALMLIFFIPGYAFIAAMFPKRGEISLIERFTLSVGFSIAIMVFDGFAVSMTRWLFRPNSISISLFILTLIFSAIAYLARRRLHESEQYTFSLKAFIQSIKSDEIDIDPEGQMEFEEKQRFKIKNRAKISSKRKSETAHPIKVERVPPEIEKALIIALVGSIIIASGMLVYAKLTQEKETFTALYILGDGGKAENYPSNASLGTPITVTVGIENYELTDVNYILQMRLDGNVIQEISVPIKDGEKWMDNLTYTATQIRQGRSKLEFVIYKEKVEGSPYRSVHLYITHTYLPDYLGTLEELLNIPVIKNSNMELNASWTFVSSTGNVNGSYVNGSGIYASRAFVINNSFEGTLPQWADQYHSIEQNIISNDNGSALLSAFIKDSYTSPSPREGETQFKQILIGNILIWEDGISGDEGWKHIQIPVYLKAGNNTLTLRLKQNGHSNVYPVEVMWDDVNLQPLSELSPYLSNESTVEFDMPTSKVLPLPEYSNSTDFTVEWNGTDIGSGISYYIIDYSKDNTSWYNWLLKTEDTSAVFTGNSNNTYYFRSRAVDNADNTEIEHTGFDTKTTVDVTPPTLKLTISPNPSSGLTRLTVTSSETLANLDCQVTPQNFNLGTNSVQMTSTNGITWTGKYTVRISTDHSVEITGKDLAYNKGTTFGIIRADTTLNDFTILITPDPTSTGTLTIKVTPSVALKSNPSITAKDGSSYAISLSSPTISDDEYTYTATINSTTREGNGTVEVTGYTMDSTKITGSATFIIDRTYPAISNLVPANGTTINTSTTTISATFSDARTPINLNNIILKINGTDVTASATITSTSIVYPASGLANGSIAIHLTVADAAGNAVTQPWVFNVNIPS
ncbi:MAG: DUF1616 domain-containing protein [Methanosarcinaceae archaeon]|nr:DUF1616 domain-containing protein [Methanosarcinaceae archaeon]